MKPPIPEAELNALMALASLPTKTFPTNPHHLLIWVLVYQMKAAMTLPNERAVPFWKALCVFLDDAAKNGDFRTLDEYAKAWATWETPRRPSRESVTFHPPGLCGNLPRRKTSMAVLEAIRELQQRTSESGLVERAPTAREILDLIGNYLGTAIDDSELSRQLNQLGLQGRLSSSRDLAS